MKRGFSLLEITIAIFIAALMTMGLYQLLRTTQRSVATIVRIIDLDTPLMALYSQLERDIAGLFVPASTEEFYRAQEKQKNINYGGQQPAPAPAQAEQRKDKKIDNIFYVENKNGGFIWSFITTAALQKFDKKNPVSTVPAVRRVAYILEKHPERPTLMRLMYRYATDDLSVTTIEKADFKPSYELIEYIKQLSLEFTVFEYQEKGDKKEAKQPVTIDQWKEAQMREKYKSLIPAYITVRGTLTDAQGRSEYPFEFKFKVLSYQEYNPQEQKAPRVQPDQLLGQLDKFLSEKLQSASPTATGPAPAQATDLFRGLS